MEGRRLMEEDLSFPEDDSHLPAAYQGPPPPPPNAFTAANFAALVARVDAIENQMCHPEESKGPTDQDEAETEEPDPVGPAEPAVESNVVHAENVESADNVEHAERVGPLNPEQDV